MYSFNHILASLNDEAERIIEYLLAEYDIRPVIVGGLALQKFGYRRLTEDIDLLLSRRDYNFLVDEGKIRYGQLKIKPGVQIDVLTEGKDENPDPEVVRDGNSLYPTLEGLIYLKLLAGRMKDKADVVELLKINSLSPNLYRKVANFLPDDLIPFFIDCWDTASKEINRPKY